MIVLIHRKGSAACMERMLFFTESMVYINRFILSCVFSNKHSVFIFLKYLNGQKSISQKFRNGFVACNNGYS